MPTRKCAHCGDVVVRYYCVDADEWDNECKVSMGASFAYYLQKWVTWSCRGCGNVQPLEERKPESSPADCL